MGASHSKTTGSLLWLTLANGIYDSHTLYDDEGNSWKEIGAGVARSSGKFTSPVVTVVKHKDKAQGFMHQAKH